MVDSQKPFLTLSKGISSSCFVHIGLVLQLSTCPISCLPMEDVPAQTPCLVVRCLNVFALGAVLDGDWAPDVNPVRCCVPNPEFAYLTPNGLCTHIEHPCVTGFEDARTRKASKACARCTTRGLRNSEQCCVARSLLLHFALADVHCCFARPAIRVGLSILHGTFSVVRTVCFDLIR